MSDSSTLFFFFFLQHGTDLGVLHRFTRQLVSKDRLHHHTTTSCQDRQQTVTQAMRLLVASLQPNPGLCADLSGIQLHLVIPVGSPLVVGPQVLDVAEDFFVRIALIASRHHECIHLQALLALRRGGVVLGGVDVDAHSILRAVVLNPRDLAGGKDAVLPLLLIGVLDALQVKVVVDLFDQLKADHAVVGRLVCGKGALALFGGQVIESLHALRIEDFVHTNNS